MLPFALVAAAILLFAGGAAVASPEPAAPMPLVLRKERAEGVDQRLLAALDEWEATGTHQLMVGENGGLRTDAGKQLEYFATGASKARTLKETPHGRGGALDLWPCIEAKPRFDLDVPEVRALYDAQGAFFKARGFVWGGDWGWDFPHVEVPDWRTLPYPPLSTASGA